MKIIMILTTLLTFVTLSINTSVAKGLSKSQMASLQLGVIQKHSTEASNVLRKELLQDIGLFLNQYRGLPIIAEAYFLKGKLLKKQRDEESALITWLQVMYEYPGSKQAIAAKQQISFLFDSGGYKYPYKQKIDKIINAKKKGKLDFRIISLIRQLSRINNRGLSEALKGLEVDFLYRYPYHTKAHEIQFLLAKSAALVAKRPGAFAYEKFLVLYPNSIYQPNALFSLAEIQYHDLNQFDEAQLNYKKLIHKYPKHKLVAKAYISLATLLEEEMDKTPEAIHTFSMVVKYYPTSKESLLSLQTIAELEENKLEKPRSAVASLRKLARLFKNKKQHEEESLEALDKASRIAIKDLEDNNLYVEIMKQTYQDFPESKIAPEIMFDLAEFKAEKNHDMAGAKALYKQIIKKYPKSDYAEDARDNFKE